MYIYIYILYISIYTYLTGGCKGAMNPNDSVSERTHICGQIQLLWDAALDILYILLGRNLDVSENRETPPNHPFVIGAFQSKPSILGVFLFLETPISTSGGERAHMKGIVSI